MGNPTLEKDNKSDSPRLLANRPGNQASFRDNTPQSLIAILKKARELETARSYEKLAQARPIILSRNCIANCHRPSNPDNGFRLSLQDFSNKSDKASYFSSESIESLLKSAQSDLPVSESHIPVKEITTIVASASEFEILREDLAEKCRMLGAEKIAINLHPLGFSVSVYPTAKDSKESSTFIVQNMRPESLFRLGDAEKATLQNKHSKLAKQHGLEVEKSRLNCLSLSKSEFSQLGSTIAGFLETIDATRIDITRQGSSEQIRILRNGPKIVEVNFNAVSRLRLQNTLSCTLSVNSDSIKINDISGIEVDVGKYLPWLSPDSAKINNDGSAGVYTSISILGTDGLNLGSNTVSGIRSTISNLSKYRQASALLARADAEDSYRRRYPEVFGPETTANESALRNQAQELLAKRKTENLISSGNLFSSGGALGSMLSGISFGNISPPKKKTR